MTAGKAKIASDKMFTRRNKYIREKEKNSNSARPGRNVKDYRYHCSENPDLEVVETPLSPRKHYRYLIELHEGLGEQLQNSGLLQVLAELTLPHRAEQGTW